MATHFIIPVCFLSQLNYSYENERWSWKGRECEAAGWGEGGDVGVGMWGWRARVILKLWIYLIVFLEQCWEGQLVLVYRTILLMLSFIWFLILLQYLVLFCLSIDLSDERTVDSAFIVWLLQLMIAKERYKVHSFSQACDRKMCSSYTPPHSSVASTNSYRNAQLCRQIDEFATNFAGYDVPGSEYAASCLGPATREEQTVQHVLRRSTFHTLTY